MLGLEFWLVFKLAILLGLQTPARAPRAQGCRGPGVQGCRRGRGLALICISPCRLLLLLLLQVFDTSYVKRGRKDAQAADRAAEAALEARLRGPHSFPLERLLHIFYALYQQQGEDEEEEEKGHGQGGARGAEQVRTA